jgi:Tol biopolymer transport system component
MRRLLAAALVVLAAGGATASAGRTPRYWIVLGSDRDGTSRAYSVGRDGSRMSPILARPFTPLALSRDGSTIAYTGDFALYVSRPDGMRMRRLAKSVYVSSEQLPALSQDGRLVAFARLSARGLWIVRTDGRGLRRVALSGFYPDWSPDGKALVLTGDSSIIVQPLRGRARVVARGSSFALGRAKWSPSGRWIAYVDSTKRAAQKGVWIVRPNGTQRHRVARDAPSTLTWSPDGTILAYGRADGVGLVRVAGGRPRALRLGFAAGVSAWSPDGRLLALVGHRGDDPDQIWVVRRDGHGLRRLTSAGRNTALGWTALAPRLSQVRAVPPAERISGTLAVTTRTPIGELSADGPRVAFVPNASRVDCDHVTVWTPAARSLARLGARLPAPCANLGTLPYLIYDLALAGTRVAWADVEGCGNSCDVALKTATLARPHSAMVTDAGGGGGAGGGDLFDFHFRGHGGLLVFDNPYREPAIERIGNGRETTLRRGSHVAFVESVSQNRIAIHEADAVTVLDDHGAVVRVFPFGRGDVRAVRLDGDRLVVSRGDVLEVYDVATGAAEVQRPLPTGYELVDADGGIAVLQRRTDILLLRLADGRSFGLAPGRGPVLADLEPTGLYFSYAVAAGGGRLVLMPREEIERRLGP